MKNLYKVLNIFALAAVIALLGGCFSPWEGDGATITINVGGGGRWTAFHLLDDDAKARISYMLDLSGPSNMTDVPFAPGTQTINLSVTPGIYTITVTAYLDGEVYAAGSTTAEARAGQSTPVDILMSYAGKTIEKTFTVTFDSNGGSPVDQQTVPNGGMAAPPARPTKSGEGFVRWCSDVTLDMEYDFNTPVTSDITLYAQWSRIIYTVIFNSNDGSPIEDELVGEGGKVTLPEENPTRSGFVFGGWYSDPSLTTLYIFAYQIYSNTTIYAKWIPQFTVTFNTNGGSPVPTQQTVTQGGTLPPPEKDPILNGSVFGGWYLESGTDFTTPYDFDIPVIDNITLCAKWNDAVFDNITDLGAYLSKWSDNDADNPYIVSLNVGDISTLRTTLNDNAGKYVNLDLSGSTTMTTIPANAFYGNADPRGCATLVGITIPNSVETIGNNAFRSCTNLASITIPDSVKTIGQSAFSSCTNLASVTIGSGVTSIGIVAGTGQSVFGSCRSLTEINVSGDNTSYTAEGGVLYNKTKTTLVAYPSATDSFTIPDDVTYIEIWAFSDCTGLTSITIPDNVTSIGQYTFYSCTNLASVTIPNKVTSIGIGAFSNCVSLASVTIPASVITIGDFAFRSCNSLTSVTFETGSDINSMNFGSGNSGDAFPGGDNLKYAYLGASPKAGTYTREENGTTWTKSQ
jgi:uncharacterized repeat protein (TIGR02543 family)